MKIHRTEEYVRICFFKYLNRAISSVKSTMSGVYGSGPKFVGHLSEPMNWMSSAAFGYERFNYTSVIRKSSGRCNETSGWSKRMYHRARNLSNPLPFMVPTRRSVCKKRSGSGILPSMNNMEKNAVYLV